MADPIPGGSVSPPVTHRETGRPVPPPRAAGVPGTERDNNLGNGNGNGNAPATAAPNDDQFRLPPALDKDYAVIRPLGGGGEADVFLVRDRITGDQRVAKVYRPGTPDKAGPGSKASVLERITRDNSPHLVRVHQFHINDTRSWELQEYIESSLQDLLAGISKPISSKWVRELLEVLNPALEYLHSLEIEHRDLKPSNILVRSRDPLSIALSDFGIASVTKATLHFTNHAACTPQYAPPEALSGAINRTRWDYWSLGMMLVELLTGRHPLLDDGAAGDARWSQRIQNRLSNDNTDGFVVGVTDPAWKKLCRGLLRRDAKLRWGSREVARWLANPADSRLTVAEEATPAVAARAAQSIRFLGKDHTQPETLAEAFAANWEKAADYWRQDSKYTELHNWLTHELGSSAHADVLAGIRKSAQTLDAQLFAVIQTLAPERTPSFQGEALTAQNLKQLADTVRTSPSAVAKWLELDRHRILQIAGQKHAKLAAIYQDQQQALAAYAACRKIVHENAQTAIAVGELSDRDRAFLLSSVVPRTSVLAQEGELLRAEIALVGQTGSLAWAQQFNSVANAQAAAMLLTPSLAAAAKAETEQLHALSAFRVAKVFCVTLATLPVTVLLAWLGYIFLEPLVAPLQLFHSPRTFAFALLCSFAIAAFVDQYESSQKKWAPFLFLDPAGSMESSVAAAMSCAIGAALSIGMWASIAALIVWVVQVIFIAGLVLLAIIIFGGS